MQQSFHQTPHHLRSQTVYDYPNRFTEMMMVLVISQQLWRIDIAKFAHILAVLFFPLAGRLIYVDY